MEAGPRKTETIQSTAKADIHGPRYELYLESNVKVINYEHCESICPWNWFHPERLQLGFGETDLLRSTDDYIPARRYPIRCYPDRCVQMGVLIKDIVY